MSRSKAKHRQEKKRRHERQIEKGVRKPRTNKSITRTTTLKRRVLLSEVDPDVVKAVINVVRNIDVYDKKVLD